LGQPQGPLAGQRPYAPGSAAQRGIEYEGDFSLEPLPKGASPYDARSGHIPAEKLDAELRIGLTHLREMQRLIRVYV